MAFKKLEGIYKKISVRHVNNTITNSKLSTRIICYYEVGVIDKSSTMSQNGVIDNRNVYREVNPST